MEIELYVFRISSLYFDSNDLRKKKIFGIFNNKLNEKKCHVLSCEYHH